MKTNVIVIEQANGLFGIEHRGKTIASDIRDKTTALLSAHHFTHAPSLAKSMGFKPRFGSVDGTIWARPFWGVKVEVVKTSDGRWQTLCEVDGETREMPSTKTKNEALIAIRKIGSEMVTTQNILNPAFGNFPISRSEKGGCTDPGTERYHSM